MTAIADARLRLHTQLRAYLADILDVDRVHLYTPTIIASPCVWIAQPSIEVVESGGSGAKVRVLVFPVCSVPDGYEPEQCALLDEIEARVSDAIWQLARTNDGGAFPRPVDIGGPSVRGVVHNARMTVFANSFCTRPPNPITPFTEEARRG